MSYKLTCIVTGKTLLASEQYYKKKLEKAQSEQHLHQSYVCREAKNLLLKGLTVEQIRKQFQVPDVVPWPDSHVIKSIVCNDYGMVKSTTFSNLTGFTRQETDPEVLGFLNNL